MGNRFFSRYLAPYYEMCDRARCSQYLVEILRTLGLSDQHGRVSRYFHEQSFQLMTRTAIYFPIVIVFLAQTQGTLLSATQYVIVVLLSTLASIGVTPIPSASLVLMVMICNSINLPVTGMYAVVVAIDWFVDRFRTAVNVSGDIFAAGILAKLTGIVDDPEDQTDPEMAARQAQEMYERETRVG
jgi:Na+/H+-dicarboxylate symporter